jgi:hypothetical protein
MHISLMYTSFSLINIYIYILVIGSRLNLDKQARHSARGHDLLSSNGRLQGYVEVFSFIYSIRGRIIGSKTNTN